MFEIEFVGVFFVAGRNCFALGIVADSPQAGEHCEACRGL